MHMQIGVYDDFIAPFTVASTAGGWGQLTTALAIASLAWNSNWYETAYFGPQTQQTQSIKWPDAGRLTAAGKLAKHKPVIQLGRVKYQAEENTKTWTCPIRPLFLFSIAKCLKVISVLYPNKHDLVLWFWGNYIIAVCLTGSSDIENPCVPMAYPCNPAQALCQRQFEHS